jgi:hypothetical protein
VDDTSHLYVEASFPSVTANCVWDSGAGMTIVDQAFWSRHRQSFRTVGPRVGMDAAGEQRSLTTYEVSGMLIGGHEFSAHHVAIVNLSAVNETLAQPMDIVLGYPTLRQANWYFDVPQRLWSITGFRSESA